MPLIFFSFLDDLGNFKQKKISGTFKSTTITVEVQALSVTNITLEEIHYIVHLEVFLKVDVYIVLYLI